MIKLVTGQPGHGKTLHALELALAFVKEGRIVYEHGIRGIDHEKTGIKPLDSLADWESLPDGSVVVGDECWKELAPLGPSKPKPSFMTALATHRHRGFDFILITQQVSQIDTFVRGLVDIHIHVRRKFGLERSVLLTWDRCVVNPAANGELKSARVIKWKYPAHIFDLYKSAELHTVKRSIPKQVFMIPVFLLLVVGCIGFVFYRFSHRADVEPESSTALAKQADDKGPLGPSSRAAKSERHTDTVEEYAQARVPRVPGQPWSAPLFDDRKPVANPELYCVSSESGKCICHTEQGTRYAIARSECLAIVTNGLYNPYRTPMVSAVRTHYEAELPTESRVRGYESRPGISYHEIPRSPNQSIRAPALPSSVN